MWSFILSFSILFFPNIWQFNLCDAEIEGLENEPRILCKEGWFPFMNSCYKYIPDKLNWHDAEARCQSHGSHLVHITNKLVDKYLAEYYELLFFTQTWIGAKKEAGAENWVWTNDKPVNYNDWSYLDIFPLLNGEKCASIIGNPGSGDLANIFGARCNTALPFVCEKIAPDSGCGEDLLYDGHCYYFSKRDVSWSIANSECKERHSKLLEVDRDYDKEHFIEGKIHNSWLLDDYPRYEVITHSSICHYLRAKLEVLNSDLGYGVWNEDSCDTLKPFICEYPINNEGLLQLNKCEKGTPWKLPIREWSPGDPFDSLELEECTATDYHIECSPLFECNLKTSACCPRENVFYSNERCKEGWEQYSEACYLFRTDLQTWNDANSHCLRLSGHLAEIPRNDELQFIKEKINNGWIGNRHYNTNEEDITSKEVRCTKISDLNTDSTSHHSKQDCLSLRPYVCQYSLT